MTSKKKLSPFIFDPEGPADRPETGFGENLILGIEQGLERTSLGLLARTAPFWRAGTQMTQEEFDETFGMTGIEYRPGMTWERAQATIDAHREAQDYADIESRRTTGGAVAGFVGNLAGGLFDPINLIPLGGGLAASTLGKSVARSVALEVALPGLALTLAEAGVRDQEQLPMSLREFGLRMGMQLGIGTFASVLGHGLRLRAERVMERSRQFALGIDGEGNPIPPPSQVGPPVDLPGVHQIQEVQDLEELIDQITPERVAPVPAGDVVNTIKTRGVRAKARQELDDWLGVMRNFGFNRQANPRLGDTDLIERGFGPSNTVIPEVAPEVRSRYRVARDEAFPGVRIVIDENGNRILVPISRGNTLGFAHFVDAPERRDVSETNLELRDQLEQELSASGRGSRTRENRIANIELLHRKLHERADRTVNDPDWKPGETVEGVLVNRRSHGNELRLKEIPIKGEPGDTDNAWWPRVIEQRSAGAGHTNWKALRGDLGVLTKKQFGFWVHEVVKDQDLQRLIRARGLRTAPGMTKAEKGDLLFQDLHRAEYRGPGRPERSSTIRAENAENLARVDKRIAEALDQQRSERINAAKARADQAIREGKTTEEVAEIEAGPVEDPEQFVEQAIGRPLDELRTADAKVRVEAIRALKNKNKAIKAAIQCLIDLGE